MSELNFWNTLTRTKERFEPIDDTNVRMYVCGPTVYDFAHIGNARPVIVFDVLYRLLRHVYGADHVTYVRNITDVDDKINARALRDYPDLPLNEAIAKVTEKTAERFHKDAAALGCLEPTHEPRATAHIDGMVAMIQTLLDSGHAYVARGQEGREALFDVRSMEGKGDVPPYGLLSRRNLEDQKAGARIEIKDHKRNPEDFVLWKESATDEPGWDATFTISDENRTELQVNDNTISIHGRPGWHIECSVMSKHHLGEVFDIHGGGLDLIFPHHENEIAQSCCAHGRDRMANLWMHNGFLQVEGRKMSKSEGNFVTIAELLETEKFGGRKWPGEVLRLAMLMTHYREPIDFSVNRLEEAEARIDFWFDIVAQLERHKMLEVTPTSVLSALGEDMNTPKAIAETHKLSLAATSSVRKASEFFSALVLLGFVPSLDEFKEEAKKIELEAIRSAENLEVADQLKSGTSVEAIGAQILEMGRRFSEPGVPSVEFFRLFNEGHSFLDINDLILRRLAFIAAKNWPEADRIRDELLAKGIQLKDGKDPETGERVTTWEVKR